MVKGISRQVIVVQAPDPKLFEQAIFILKDEVVNNKGITDEVLLKEAYRLINTSKSKKQKNPRFWGLLWAGTGALITGMLWVLSAMF